MSAAAPASAAPTASEVMDSPDAKNASISWGSAMHRLATVPLTTHKGKPHSAKHQVAQRPASRLPTAASTMPSTNSTSDTSTIIAIPSKKAPPAGVRRRRRRDLRRGSRFL